MPQYDDFERASLGAKWTDVIAGGVIGMEIHSSTALGGQDNGDCHSAWNTGIWANDQRSGGTLVASLAEKPQPSCRHSGTGLGDGYCIYYGGVNHSYFRLDAGSYTKIGANIGTPDLTGGELYAIEAIGTTLRAWVDGTSLATRTDSNHVEGLPGLGCFQASSPDLVWETFEPGHGDITPAVLRSNPWHRQLVGM